METKLPSKLQTGPFTYREACQEGLTQYSLRKLLENGDIERIERGLYQNAEIDLSEDELYKRAVKSMGEPAVVCLLSALSFYDLTDTIPKQVWLMVPANKRTRNKSIKLYRSRDPHWKKGVLKEDGFLITTLERTIVDCLTTTRLLPTRYGINALKQAIQGKKTTAARILRMADSLGVKHRVFPYIEALS